MMPEMNHQMAAVIEKVEAAGLSPLAWVERGHPDPDAEHRQQDLDDQRDDDAGEDRAPRDPVDHDGVGVVVDGGAGTGRGGMRAGRVVHGRGGIGVLGQRLEPLLGCARRRAIVAVGARGRSHRAP